MLRFILGIYCLISKLADVASLSNISVQSFTFYLNRFVNLDLSSYPGPSCKTNTESMRDYMSYIREVQTSHHSKVILHAINNLCKLFSILGK